VNQIFERDAWEDLDAYQSQDAPMFSSLYGRTYLQRTLDQGVPAAIAFAFSLQMFCQ
jgi:hypothetical protein